MIYNKHGEVVIIGLYVDDSLVLRTHDGPGSHFAKVKAEFFKRWKATQSDRITDFLGVQFERDGDRIKLHQAKYIEKLVKKYLPQGGAKVLHKNKAPAAQDLAQVISDAQCQEAVPDSGLLRRYQSLVGALLYCAVSTRPDVSYAVAMLCRAMSKPTQPAYDAAVRVLAYLDNHRHLGLTYEAGSAPLHGFSDASWEVRHSTSGWLYKWQSAAISWGSKRQPCVALSSCEAEIIAASEATKEAVFLRRLLAELGFDDETATNLYVDNKAAIDLAYNPEHHSKTKHIERRHFFVREKVEDHEICVPFVKTVDNLADFFTKALDPAKFWPMRDAIMNVPEGRSA